MVGKATTTTPPGPAAAVRYFTTRHGTLHRWAEVGERLSLSRWDREAGGWVYDPNLFAVTGIGGDHPYEEITPDDAEAILKGWGVAVAEVMEVKHKENPSPPPKWVPTSGEGPVLSKEDQKDFDSAWEG